MSWGGGNEWYAGTARDRKGTVVAYFNVLLRHPDEKAQISRDYTVLYPKLFVS
jgi:hypothetical protein